MAMLGRLDALYGNRPAPMASARIAMAVEPLNGAVFDSYRAPRPIPYHTAVHHCAALPPT